MSDAYLRRGPRLAGAVLLAASTLLAGPVARAAGSDAGAKVTPVIAEKLPNVPGKTLTATW